MRRREVERQEQGREVLRVQLRRVGLVVVYLGIGGMVATAVHEDAIHLRKDVFLARPGPHVSQRAMDEDDRRRAAITRESIREARAVEVERVEGALERPQRWTALRRRTRGRRVLRARLPTAGDDEQAAQRDSHVYRMAIEKPKRHQATSHAAAAATFCSARHRATLSPSAVTLCLAALGRTRSAFPSSS